MCTNQNVKPRTIELLKIHKIYIYILHEIVILIETNLNERFVE